MIQRKEKAVLRFDDKTKQDEQRRRLQKQLREIKRFSDMDQIFGDGN